MRFLFLAAISLLLASVPTVPDAVAQQQQAVPVATAPASIHPSGAATTADVPDDTPVITMDGYCESVPAGTVDRNPCRTTITRSDFEKLVQISGSSDRGRSQLAAFYVKFSLLAREAQKQGLDKDPTVRKKLELARMQALGQVMMQTLQTRSEHFAPGDLEKYFRENPAQFERATLLRIFIPYTRFKDLSGGMQQPIPETAAEMRSVANSIYSRALAGGDFEELQKEALGTANLRQEMAAQYGTIGRSQLRNAQQGTFDLKPGEISRLYSEKEEGYYIYKVVSKAMPNFDSVKAEVATALERNRMDTWLKEINDSAQVSVNENFFGTNPLAK